MGFFDAVAGAAKQAAKPAPQSGLGAVVQAVAQGSQRGAQQAASTNVGAAAAVGASQGASQARAQAQAAHNALAAAIQNVPNRPLPASAVGPLATMLGRYQTFQLQTQALRNFMTKTGFVDSAKSLGVQPIDLLYGSASKGDKQFLAYLLAPPRPIAWNPDSQPLKGNAMPIPTDPSRWKMSQGQRGRAYSLPLSMAGQPPNRGLD